MFAACVALSVSVSSSSDHDSSYSQQALLHLRRYTTDLVMLLLASGAGVLCLGGWLSPKRGENVVSLLVATALYCVIVLLVASTSVPDTLFGGRLRLSDALQEERKIKKWIVRMDSYGIPAGGSLSRPRVQDRVTRIVGFSIAVSAILFVILVALLSIIYALSEKQVDWSGVLVSVAKLLALSLCRHCIFRALRHSWSRDFGLSVR